MRSRRDRDRSERGVDGFGRLDPRSESRAATSWPSAPSIPCRARTWTPGRLTRTLISWNLPSEGAWVELYPSR